ncbi:uncharacterized protein LOC109710650 [Ananas comosus]|uniref:Uncharacterized protein LOC109710650 n=1 Tax=Ananas comosus TaxID=4615 RepID=A0A6P5F6T3_ANACO|nr:uncharacterized protein LOC109710650 [Ananas comosus]
MQTVSLYSSRPPIFPPPIKNPAFPCTLPRAISPRRRRPTASFSVPRRRDRGGDSVDEDLITLRKRIREMRDAERANDGGDDDGDEGLLTTTSDWTEWERQYYEEQYLSDVCEFVGLVQTLLMSTRPSVAVGSIALIGLSVPTALILIALRLAEALALMHGN